jgi:hypothetical protein
MLVAIDSKWMKLPKTPEESSILANPAVTSDPIKLYVVNDLFFLFAGQYLCS